MSTELSSAIQLLIEAYQAFNARNINQVLSLMVYDVTWPNGMEGGYVYGHAAVRDYWTRQWQQVDPHVEPIDFIPDTEGRILVRAHQVVRDLSGNVSLDQPVEHLYTLRAGLIQTMEILVTKTSR